MSNRPKDPREFIRMSVDIARHPKIVGMADPAAAWGYAAAMAYAGKYHTDGWITVRTIASEAGISTQKARKLVTAGLVHEHGHACEKCPEIPKGQAYLHDYLEHNRSKDDVEQQRRSHQVRGQKGAAKRWAPTAETSPKTPPKTDSNSYANNHGNKDGKSYGKTMAEVEEEKELPTHLTTSPPVSRRASANTRARDLATTARRANTTELVQRWNTNRGHSYTRTDLTNLARQLDALLADNANPTHFEATLDIQHRDGHSPNFLPHAYREALKTHTGPGSPLPAGVPARPSKPSTTDQRVADIQALKQQMLAAEVARQSGQEPGLRLIEGAAS